MHTIMPLFCEQLYSVSTFPIREVLLKKRIVTQPNADQKFLTANIELCRDSVTGMTASEMDTVPR